MFETPFQCNVWIGYVDPERPDAWGSSEVQEMIGKINQAGHSVVILLANGINVFSLAEGQSKDEMHEQVNGYCRANGISA
jgi:hypothetical protein